MLKKSGKISILAVVLLGIFSSPTLSEAVSDPGVQLNRTREYLERQRVAEEIREGQEKLKGKVDAEAGEKPSDAVDENSFLLQKVQVDSSEVLNNDDIVTITAQYVNKEVTIKDLYSLVEAINGLYQQKGYVTCRAVLPAQTIKEGVVHIQLIEGRTGNVVVQGNKTTDEKYITNRIELEPEKIANINDLNKELLLFNGTNDVQLRISLEAGTEPGTTDYVISAYEPKRSDFTFYTDNAGYDTSGKYRAGLFFTERSLSGQRDSLNISTMFSEGTKSLSTYYSRPINKKGTRIAAQFSMNRVDVIDGPMEPMDVEGKSHSYSLAIQQPLKVTEKYKTEASLEYSYLNSETAFTGVHWNDDKISGVTAAFAKTNYGKSSVFYHKHAYRFFKHEDIRNNSENYGKYILNMLYQKAYNSGQLIKMELNGQWSGDNYLPSAEQFYIGGVYSVRGYDEGLLSGDKGYNLTFEYSIPVSSDASVYTFLDYGYVGGDSAFDDNSLMGAGVGFKKSFGSKIYGNVSLGVPLMKDINGNKVSSAKLHFMLNGQF